MYALIFIPCLGLNCVATDQSKVLCARLWSRTFLFMGKLCDSNVVHEKLGGEKDGKTKTKGTVKRMDKIIP